MFYSLSYGKQPIYARETQTGCINNYSGTANKLSASTGSLISSSISSMASAQLRAKNGTSQISPTLVLEEGFQVDFAVLMRVEGPNAE